MKNLIVIFACLIPAVSSAMTVVPYCGYETRRKSSDNIVILNRKYFAPVGPCQAVSGIYQSISFDSCANMAQKAGMACYQIGDVTQILMGVMSRVSGQICYGCVETSRY